MYSKAINSKIHSKKVSLVKLNPNFHIKSQKMNLIKSLMI